MNLKDFLKKNINGTPDNLPEKEEEENNDIIKISYEDWGFLQAKHLNGGLKSFKGCMALVKEDYKNKILKDKRKRQEVIDEAQSKLANLEGEIQAGNSTIENLKKKTISLKEKIENLKKDIIRIKENPESVMKDKTSKVGFIFGLIILFFLTVYLFIFYSSASYSGFFKNFTQGDNIANSIFDPKAIQSALKGGTMELLLILTIPFVFLGLGYIIHKFLQEKGFVKYLKAGMMILITLAFDGLLAYKIEKGLYEVERMMDPTGSLPRHTIEMAFNSENFWLVIFAGFVVYIIWGFLFDFVMDAYDKLDVVNQAIKARETEIKLYQEDIENNDKKITSIEEEIIEKEKEVVTQKSIINGSTVIIDWSEFGKQLTEFANGWAKWMNANRIPKEEIDIVWEAHSEYLIYRGKPSNPLSTSTQDIIKNITNN